MDKMVYFLYFLALVFITYGAYNIYYNQSIQSRGYLPIVLGIFLSLGVYVYNESKELASIENYEKISLNEIRELAST
jgi:hypothetical protein